MRLERRCGAEYRDRKNRKKKLSDAPAHAVQTAEPVPVKATAEFAENGESRADRFVYEASFCDLSELCG
jgi:hypothetical protein